MAEHVQEHMGGQEVAAIESCNNLWYVSGHSLSQQWRVTSAGYQGLPHLPENSPELRAAHFNLRNIRIARAAGFPAARGFLTDQA